MVRDQALQLGPGEDGAGPPLGILVLVGAQLVSREHRRGGLDQVLDHRVPEQRLKSSPTNPLRVAGIADPSPLPALRRKTGNNKYRHLRRALAAGRLGAPARSGICREALNHRIDVVDGLRRHLAGQPDAPEELDQVAGAHLIKPHLPYPGQHMVSQAAIVALGVRQAHLLPLFAPLCPVLPHGHRPHVSIASGARRDPGLHMLEKRPCLPLLPPDKPTGSSMKRPVFIR